ncbi:MAG: glycoside hydrolase family 9 protein [Ruminococcus sp.]|nr:glycoside hydrolase family 9 protein [Ruminococcus sp.]
MKAIRRALSAGCAAVIAAGTVVPVIDVFAGEQLGQTDFENGVGLPWHICESGPGEMDFEISDGVYKITILNPGGASRGGEDRWDCQFRHRGLKIVSGHQYKVHYEITPSHSGKYYTKIGNLEGDVEIWHNMATGQWDLDSNWDPIQIGANEKKVVDLTFTAGQSLDVAEWAFHLGGEGQYTQGDCFPVGTVITFDNMSLVDLTSDENDYKAPEVWKRAEILTNQVGYFTDRKKQATLICSDKESVELELIDQGGKSVYSGKSTYFGEDPDSGDTVHIFDFSDFRDSGTYHIEAANGAKSREFQIGGSTMYSALLYDALNYFYQNRSGIEIKADFITSGDKNSLARAAGHTTDNAEIQQTWGYTGSSGSQDVTGGWYDAGDHGKYVVNGGLSVWLMQNQYESAVKYGFSDGYEDGSMNLPENNNGYPDLLDEARWEMEWMLKMIVQTGDFAGMAYHKAHDEKWTALGTAPAQDEEKRIIKPPTTAATLNLAACGAQAARLWENIDKSFSDKCLKAAEEAYAAAKKHPSMYAPLDESVGGGAYGDDDVSDEFYWAACELYITTGKEDYYKDAAGSDFFMKMPTSLGGGESVDSVGSFDWGNTAGLGTLSAAISGKGFEDKDRKAALDSIKAAADHYLELEDSQGYGVPYGSSTISYNDSDKGYMWGSNSFVADNSVVMAYGYLLTGEDKYLDGVIGGLDYLLGRNAMDQSYVTGYGTHSTENPHHRWWSNQIDAAYPKAPCGVMAGGPNSGMQDPWVQGSGWKKGQIAPQKCYLDHIEAWSVNECTINWNASLAWIAGFAAAENGGIEIGSVNTAERINNGGDGQSNENGTADAEGTSSSQEENKESSTAGNSESPSEDKSERDTSESAPDQKTDSKPEDKESSSKTGLIALIVGGALAALISVEVFVYKVMKLKKQ